MSAILSVIKEEQLRLKQLCNKYESEISKLPVGSLSIKKRRDIEYAYLAHRRDGKVKFKYLGKADSEKVAKLGNLVKERQRYQKLLRQARKDLKEAERMQRGK